MSVTMIAEAGVNHNGSYQLAQRLVEKAALCGADFVKFQTFRSKSAVSSFAPKAEYQQKTTGPSESQYEMVKKLELPFEAFIRLQKHCAKNGIAFLSTAFDLESIEFLSTLGLTYWKIPSGEITNLPYLLKIAATHKPILLSTGMCMLEEVEQAIRILQDNGAGELTLLHCTTQYPTPFEDVNLKAMLTLKREFGLPVGYSDHTKGIEVPIAAVALGAVVIEKHFTLDCNMEGPDHKASLEPDELRAMVSAVRNIERAMGNGVKEPAESERANIAVARKSIVAQRAIQKGEPLTEENITIKRPGSGISPMRWFEVLGTPAVRNFADDELIEL